MTKTTNHDTLDRADTLKGKWQVKTLLKIMSGVAMVAILSAANPVHISFAQDQQDQEQGAENKNDANNQDEKKPEDKNEEKADEKSDENVAEKKPEIKTKKSLVFPVTNQPKLKLQLGPGVGKPLSVLPRPFVPVGSVSIPKPKVSANKEVQPTQLETQVKNQPETQSVNADQNPTLNSGESNIETPNQNVQNNVLLEEGALTDLDPSGVGILSNGETPIPTAFWQGLSRTDVAKSLRDFHKNGGSVTLRDLASVMVKSPLRLTAPRENSNDVQDFIKARLDLLSKSGDLSAISRLLERLPRSEDSANTWAMFDDYKTKVALGADARSDACTIAEAKVTSSRDPYWLRLLTFCYAVSGNRDQVEFQISLLDELAALSPAYFTLIDHILIEAEAGAQSADVPEVNAPLNVELLEAAMVTIARARADELNLNAIDPLAIPMMLSAPGVTDEAKIKLLEKSLEIGPVDSDSFLNFLMRYEVLEDDREAANLYLEGMKLYWAGSDQIPEAPSFITLLVLAKDSIKTDGRLPNFEALRAIWGHAIQNGYTLNILGAYKKLVEQYDVSQDNITLAPIAIRTALMAGDEARARAWFDLLRIQNAGANPIADQILIDSYPLMLLAGLSDDYSDTAAGAWWQSHKGHTQAYEKATLLATVLEASGNKVSEKFWTVLSEGPVVLKSGAVSPAQWRNLMKVAATGNSRALLTETVSIIGQTGIGNIPSSLAGSMIGNLKEAGFDLLADRLALEMLILSGL